MRCQKIQELLSAYIDGELSPRQEALVKAHLETCASCAEVHASLAKTVGALGGLSDVEAPRSLPASVLRRLETDTGRRNLRTVLVRWVALPALGTAAAAAIALTLLLPVLRPARPSHTLVRRGATMKLEMKEGATSAEEMAKKPAPETDQTVAELSLAEPAPEGAARDRMLGLKLHGTPAEPGDEKEAVVRYPVASVPISQDALPWSAEEAAGPPPEAQESLADRLGETDSDVAGVGLGERGKQAKEKARLASLLASEVRRRYEVSRESLFVNGHVLAETESAAGTEKLRALGSVYFAKGLSQPPPVLTVVSEDPAAARKAFLESLDELEMTYVIETEDASKGSITLRVDQAAWDVLLQLGRPEITEAGAAKLAPEYRYDLYYGIRELPAPAAPREAAQPGAGPSLLLVVEFVRPEKTEPDPEK